MKLFYECTERECRRSHTKDFGDGVRPSDEIVASLRCSRCFGPTRPMCYQQTCLPNMQPILGWPPAEEMAE